MPQQIPIFNQHSSSVKIHPHDSDEKQTGRQLSEQLTIRIELPGTEHIGYCGAKKKSFSRHIVTSHSHKTHFSQLMKKVVNICHRKKEVSFNLESSNFGTNLAESTLMWGL